jgi:hypothetical protein
VRIEFQQSGGFGAIKRPMTVIDDSDLAGQPAQMWLHLLDEAHFFDLPEMVPSGPGRDQFQYRVTVDHGGRKHTVRVNEGAIPPPLQPLIEQLKRANS